MKKIIFLFTFFFMFFAITAKAQKIDCACTPDLIDRSWSVELNPQVPDIADFKSLNISLVKMKEGSRMMNPKEITEAKTGLNDCVLQFLVKNQKSIPENWKGKTLIFTGTIFKDGSGSMFYKTLFFDGENWDWGRTYPEYLLESYQLVVNK